MSNKDIDSYFESHKDEARKLLFSCKFAGRVSKVSRMAYDLFGAKSPREHRRIVDYIFDMHIPIAYHNPFNWEI